MSFPSKSMQHVCITSSIPVMTSSVVVMTASVAMVIPVYGLNCDNNSIAANTMENPYSKFKFDFSLGKRWFFM